MKFSGQGRLQLNYKCEGNQCLRHRENNKPYEVETMCFPNALCGLNTKRKQLLAFVAPTKNMKQQKINL